MKKFIQIFLLSAIFLVGVFAVGGKSVLAGGLLSGRAFVWYEGQIVYLRGVDITWRVVSGKTGRYSNWNGFARREADTASVITTTYCDGASCYRITSGATTDCRNVYDSGIYTAQGGSCLVNSSTETVDEYGTISTSTNYVFVFPDISYWGNDSTTLTLTPRFPSGYAGLPGGLDPTQGQWVPNLDNLYPDSGGTTWSWDGGMQTLTVANTTREHYNIDFEWVPISQTAQKGENSSRYHYGTLWGNVWLAESPADCGLKRPTYTHEFLVYEPPTTQWPWSWIYLDLSQNSVNCPCSPAGSPTASLYECTSQSCPPRSRPYEEWNNVGSCEYRYNGYHPPYSFQFTPGEEVKIAVGSDSSGGSITTDCETLDSDQFGAMPFNCPGYPSEYTFTLADDEVRRQDFYINYTAKAPYRATINGTVSGRCQDDGSCVSGESGSQALGSGVPVTLSYINAQGVPTTLSTTTSVTGRFSFSDLDFDTYTVNIASSYLSTNNMNYTTCSTAESRTVEFSVETQGATNVFTRDIFLHDTLPYPPGNPTYCASGTDAMIETNQGDVYSAGGYDFSTPFNDKYLSDYLVVGNGIWNFNPADSESGSGWTVRNYLYGTPLTKYTYDYFWANLRKEITPEANRTITLVGDTITDNSLRNYGGAVSDKPIVRFVPGAGSDVVRTSSSGNINFNREALIVFIGSDTQDVNLEINTNISVNPGSHLVFIVSGEVRVSKSVRQMDGVYILDGQFVDLYDWGAGDTAPLQTQLTGAGNIITWGGFDLGNGTTRYREVSSDATYQFTFAPKYLVTMAPLLGEETYQWGEVAP